MSRNTDNLGAAIDELYELREYRLGLERQAKDAKKQETELEEAIIGLLGQHGLHKGAGNVAQVSLSRDEIPYIDDPEQFFSFFRRPGNEDLLQRRVAKRAWEERIKAGVNVPGVAVKERDKLNLSRQGGR